MPHDVNVVYVNRWQIRQCGEGLELSFCVESSPSGTKHSLFTVVLLPPYVLGPMRDNEEVLRARAETVVGNIDQSRYIITAVPQGTVEHYVLCANFGMMAINPLACLLDFALIDSTKLADDAIKAKVLVRFVMEMNCFCSFYLCLLKEADNFAARVDAEFSYLKVTNA